MMRVTIFIFMGMWFVMGMLLIPGCDEYVDHCSEDKEPLGFCADIHVDVESEPALWVCQAAACNELPQSADGCRLLSDFGGVHVLPDNECISMWPGMDDGESSGSSEGVGGVDTGGSVGGGTEGSGTASTESGTSETMGSGSTSDESSETDATGSTDSSTTGDDEGSGDACSDSEIECGGQCIDPATDSEFCGAHDSCVGAQAGKHCGTGETCQNGECLLSCSMGQVACASECIDPKKHQIFCGASDDCKGPNAGKSCSERESCKSGMCTINWGWSPSIFISNTIGLGDARGPRVAVEPNGSAVAIWKQFESNEARRSIWSARFRPNNRAWDRAILVENADGECDQPEIVIDGNGHATAVWENDNGIRSRLWSSRLTSGSASWSSTLPIESLAAGSSSLSEHSLAVSRSGKVSISWLHNPGGLVQDVWSNRYNPESGKWESLLRVEQGNGSAFAGSLAIDPAGRTIAVWPQRHPDDAEILRSSNLESSANAWSAPLTVYDPANTHIPMSNSHRNGYSTHAFDASGNGVLLWTHYWTANDTQSEALWWSRLKTGDDAWGSPGQVVPPAGADGYPELAVTTDGTAVATWLQQLPGEERCLMSATLAASATEWTPPVLVGPKSLGTAHRHKVVTDGNGVSTVAWSVFDGFVYNLWTSRLSPGATVWSSPVQLESEDGGSAFIGALAADANNDVTVVWRQDNGDRKDIMSARFEPQP